MNALEVRAAIALALVYVLRMLGLFMVMPVLAVAAMDYPDYSPLMVGLAIGGYGLTQAALQIPMGMMSDRWGRKPVIVLGLSVFAVGSFIAASADTMAWMIVGRILQGAGAIAGAIMALAADVSRESQRAKVMAIIGIAIGMSFYLAVLVGPLLAEQFGLAGIFWITGILALACLPLILWGIPKVSFLASGDTLPQANQLKRLFFSSQLWRLNISVMFLHMLITLLFVQLPVTLLHFNMSLQSHWTLYAPVLLASIIGLVVMMGVAKGQMPKRLLMLALVLMGAGFSLLALHDENQWVVLVAVVFFFTGFNYLEANFPALVSSIAPAGEKGTAMGIYASFQFFGAFLGGVISGWTVNIWPAETAYLIGALAVILWFLLLSGLKEVSRIKRVQLKGVATELAKSKLKALPGVVEVTQNSGVDTIYLKVTRDFDLQQAQMIVTKE
ncbi:MFS transporter [Alteromonas sp. ASW11-130]|uniref:MFS transporter n=1 Tax=Alteromonas sp. ASW11-130 TaxID=3015775 RepID=UPI0022425C2C|nr:MFS transporter [Alteromonas sp. ASW11-130]MCW8091049.1 MFS transporter [Alteromonas sp. ASW11-130]